jgi:hypothetical protein
MLKPTVIPLLTEMLLMATLLPLAACDPTPSPDVASAFAHPPAEYGPVPFYWWVGEPLTRERLSWQLDQLRAKGVLNSVISYNHGPDGATDKGEPPLFSPQWWDLFRWVVAECRKRGMQIGFEDYTIINPLLQDIGAETPGMQGGDLDHVGVQVTGPAPVSLDVPAGRMIVAALAYRTAGGGLDPASGVDLTARVRDRRLTWDAPAGAWQVVVVLHRPNRFDPMDPRAAPAVIDRLYAQFERHCPGQVGKTIPIFFQDELDFGQQMPFWSARVPDEFKRRKGYDLTPVLPALWYDLGPRTAKIRIDFCDVVTSLVEEAYFEPIFAWHEKRGVLLANDNNGRGYIAPGRATYGDYFRAMRWFSAPGNDDPVLAQGRAFVGCKVNSSIAHLYHRPRTWVEAFHSSGWGATPAQIVAGLNEDFAYGATLLNLHGLYYTTYGGWWEWAPPDFHFRQPYWQHSDAFSGYVRRLSFLLTRGAHRCDVAMVYPITTIEAGFAAAEAERDAFALGHHLFSAGIDFDFADFQSLERATVRGPELQVSGESYRVLLFPMMVAVRFSTLQKALDFFRAGGTVIAYGCLPEASDRAGADDPELAAAVQEIFGLTATDAQAGRAASPRQSPAGGHGIFIPADYARVPDAVSHSIPRDFIPSGAQLYVLHRHFGDRDAYFVFNPRDEAVHADCHFRAGGKVERWDAWTGAVTPISTASLTEIGTRVAFTLEPREAQLVVFSSGSPSRPEPLPAGASAPSTSIVLDGPWDFEIRPTLDNRWGDFRLPATHAMIGAEARQFRYAEETAPNPAWQVPGLDDSRWETTTYSFGPRFWKLGPLPPGTDTRAVEEKLLLLDTIDPATPLTIAGREYRWSPHSFSLRWGIERDPLLLHWLAGPHGLKQHVPDEFLDLTTDVAGSLWYLWSTAPATAATVSHLTVGCSGACEAWLNGKPALSQPSALPPSTNAFGYETYALPARVAPVTLSPGANRLLLRLAQPEKRRLRAYVLVGSAPVEPEVFSSAASWTWFPGEGEPASDCFFRKSFSADKTPVSARVRITCDNEYALYLNGRLVGRGTAWQVVDEYDVAAFLQPGRNVLALAARNAGGPAGLIAELVLTANDGRHTRVATDTSWRCSRTAPDAWRDSAFDDAAWPAPARLSGFAESFWATHPMGPPRLAPASLSRPPGPLALRWFAQPGAVLFDPQPAAAHVGWYRFPSPPGLRRMTIVAHGRLRAWVKGEELKVVAGRPRPDGARTYTAAVAPSSPPSVPIALRIEHEPGFYAGAALPEPVAFDCGPGQAPLGEWSGIGLATYSGAAVYRKRVALSVEQARARVALDLGAVAATARVRVNGKLAGTRIAPPWRLDVSSFVKPGPNDVEIEVTNTLANHYSVGIPSHYVFPGQTLSGLLGPVELVFSGESK